MHQNKKEVVEKINKIVKGYTDYIQETPDYYKTIMGTVNQDTMISDYALVANLDAAEYIANNKIPGAIVECGVWKGGSIKAIAMVLQKMKDDQRNLYLFDTYAGMTPPSEEDLHYQGHMAHGRFEESQRDGFNTWHYAPLEHVKKCLYNSGYDKEKIHFIKGDVAETVPPFAEKKEPIALLRLDTDFYESTKVEMEYLYDLLVPGGVLIIDDYGCWRGSRKAVDDFFEKRNLKPFLFRIDYSRRMMIKGKE